MSFYHRKIHGVLCASRAVLMQPNDGRQVASACRHVHRVHEAMLGPSVLQELQQLHIAMGRSKDPWVELHSTPILGPILRPRQGQVRMGQQTLPTDHGIVSREPPVQLGEQVGVPNPREGVAAGRDPEDILGGQEDHDRLLQQQHRQSLHCTFGTFVIYYDPIYISSSQHFRIGLQPFKDMCVTIFL